MEFTLADLSRRLENMIRFGTIAEVKHSRTPKVRVQLGDIITNWLPVTTPHAGDTKTWCPPTVGEQCIVFSPSGDVGAGIVLPGVNSKHHPAPDDNPHNARVAYPDGAVFDYDSAQHHYRISVPVAGKITINVGATTLELRNDGATLTTPRFDGAAS